MASFAQFEDDEVGYLFLENCHIKFLPNAFEGNANEWLDVEIEDNVSSDAADASHTKGHGNCHRCHVWLQEGSTVNSAQLVRPYPRFDGTMSDISHSLDKCPEYCNCRKGNNRNDASLLLGLAFSCQDLGHIRIRTIRAFKFGHVAGNLANGDPVRSTNKGNAAIAISFSMPWLEKQEKQKRGKLKAMPPSTQLLFTLMRSDWEYLESWGTHTQFQIEKSLKSGPVSLFPAKLSLEELYARIRGLQKHRKVSLTDEALPSGALMNTAIEIVRDKIVPFLRAQSLYALRCTCTHYYQELRSVVPGLNLKLYAHQVRSLEWMRRRESHALTEKEILNGTKGALSVDGDSHRSVTAGTTVQLCSRQNRQKKLKLNTEFGTIYDNSNARTDSLYLSRQIARGGLLCDDPGLGKTVTVLSLILSTWGISSEVAGERGASQDQSMSDDMVFDAYWRDQISSVSKPRPLTRLVNDLRKSNSDSYVFQSPVDRNDVPNYFAVIKHPMCFEDVYHRINLQWYDHSFDNFVTDVNLIFENARLYNGEDSPICNLADQLKTTFKSSIECYKEKELQSAKKSFSNSHARPNNSVAAILERRAIRDHLDTLIPSAATLLVVPKTLLSHWEEQIKMHVNLKYCTTKEPAIFRFRGNDSNTRAQMKELRFNCCVLKSHSPLVFVDVSRQATLPDASFLSLFKVVMTTTSRFSNEWKNGSFQEEMRNEEGRDSIYTSSGTVHGSAKSASPLLKVHWTRMIVDEGHSMGRGKRNNAILFASWICSSRRFSMTGTPTPQTSSTSGLRNLHNLMFFLKHEFFTSRMEGEKVWRKLSSSWNNGSLAAFYNLRSLLAVLMIRHTKLDLDELPPPQFERIELDLSRDEVHTFNTLVCAVQSNLLLTSMKARKSGLQDSLLSKSQSKFAREAFENLRLACSGGLRVVPNINQKAWEETVDLLESHGIVGAKQTIVVNFMQRAVTEQLSHCMVCGIELSTLLILPCGDLLCTQCQTNDNRICRVCKRPFDADDFQLLQPGIAYQWYDYHKQEKKTIAAENRTRDVETAPALDRNEAVEHVPAPLGLIRQRTHKKGDGHICEYSRAAGNGKCKLCHAEHEECVMMAEQSRCVKCGRISESCPPEEAKFHHVCCRLDSILAEKKNKRRMFSPTAASITGETITFAEDRPVKAIIFSQFRKVLDLIGHRLLKRYGAGCVAEYWGNYRSQEATKFKLSNECFCMIVSKDGSEGLDLSFVTHIFFLEEIFDKSLKEQAVARAWRMGAQGSVRVETLIAKRSIESLMTKGDQEYESISGEESSKDMLRSKMIYCLKNVRLIDNHFNKDTKRSRAEKQLEDQDHSPHSEDRPPKRRNVRFADFDLIYREQVPDC